MPEKPLLCLGEAWLELTADTPPELAGQFQVQVGGWGAGLCRAYTRCGGRAVLLSQLGADPFGRKAAAQLAADGVEFINRVGPPKQQEPIPIDQAERIMFSPNKPQSICDRS